MADNTAPAQLEPHALATKHDGFGLSSSARVHCSCGWLGPVRYEYQDDMYSRLNDDKRWHLQEHP